MVDSILESIKVLLGITDDVFDQELIMHINSVLGILSQLGFESADDFFIENAVAVWSDLFIDRTDLGFIKTYIYLRVRLIFDPPQNSFLVESIKKQCDEFEFRIQVQVMPVTIVV